VAATSAHRDQERRIGTTLVHHPEREPAQAEHGSRSEAASGPAFALELQLAALEHDERVPPVPFVEDTLSPATEEHDPDKEPRRQRPPEQPERLAVRQRLGIGTSTHHPVRRPMPAGIIDAADELPTGVASELRARWRRLREWGRCGCGTLIRFEG